MHSIIKTCSLIILQDKKDKMFFRVFDGIIDLIADFHSDVKDWAKKVDDLLKDEVYKALSR